MHSNKIIDFPLGLPIDTASPLGLLVAFPRQIAAGVHTCTEIVFVYGSFHFAIGLSPAPLPVCMLSVVERLNDNDPDYGAYMQLRAIIKEGSVNEGDDFDSRFGRTPLRCLGKWGSVRDWSMSLKIGLQEMQASLLQQPFELRILFSERELICSPAHQGLLQLIEGG